jgi:hypothetical protein
MGVGDPDHDIFTVSGLGENVQREFAGDGYWYLLDGVTADHTDDSVTLTLAGSGFEAGEGWTLPAVSVRVLRYRPSFGLPALLDSEHGLVPVTVLKTDNTEASGAQVTVTKVKHAEASINSDNEPVVLDVVGKMKQLALTTTAMVIVKVIGGGEVAATAPVLAPDFSAPSMEVVRAGVTTGTITVTDPRTHEPLVGRDFKIGVFRILQATKTTAKVLTETVRTDSHGRAKIRVLGEQFDNTGQCELVVRDVLSKAEKRTPILVGHVHLNIAAPSIPVRVGMQDPATAIVTAKTAGGQPVEDLLVRVTNDDDLHNMSVSPQGGATDEWGDIVMQIRPVQVGSDTVRIKATFDPEVTAEKTFVVEAQQ